ncbi:MAG: hypothetical protein RR696_12610 [Clostridia bacterium]
MKKSSVGLLALVLMVLTMSCAFAETHVFPLTITSATASYTTPTFNVPVGSDAVYVRLLTDANYSYTSLVMLANESNSVRVTKWVAPSINMPVQSSVLRGGGRYYFSVRLNSKYIENGGTLPIHMTVIVTTEPF